MHASPVSFFALAIQKCIISGAAIIFGRGRRFVEHDRKEITLDENSVR